MSVVIETTKGDFVIDLYIDDRPRTCLNFLKLCKIKYYNWNLFHSVQGKFIAQTGDPTGTRKGGECIYGVILGNKARYYEGEKVPKIKHDRVGLISMVGCGNQMFGSQFFVTLEKDLQSLDKDHCVFGEITEGFEIINQLNEVICDESHRPYQDIVITHTVILEDPFDDPKGLIIPNMSPGPPKSILESDRIGADENIEDAGDMTMEEIIEMQKSKEAKARATILEIVGDIPDADIAPPENVLFVCKLNPVTNDDDLEIIFSRFGKIIGCEVIRDRQSDDSLQYAFIEFADRKSCEDAYFKMDNVLIDDRRIHVDFSQSVSKIQWRGKGKGIIYKNEDKELKASKTYNRKYSSSDSPDLRRTNKHREQEYERNHRKYSYHNFPSDRNNSRKRSKSQESGRKHKVRREYDNDSRKYKNNHRSSNYQDHARSEKTRSSIKDSSASKKDAKYNSSSGDISEKKNFSEHTHREDYKYREKSSEHRYTSKYKEKDRHKKKK